jgi:GTP cyclohydrolase II
VREKTGDALGTAREKTGDALDAAREKMADVTRPSEH